MRQLLRTGLRTPAMTSPSRTMLPVVVGHLDADRRLARDRRDDPDARHGQGDRQVVGQADDLRDAQAGLELDLELGDDRPGVDLHDADLVAEVQQRPLQQHRPAVDLGLVLLDREGGGRLEQVHRRELRTPSPASAARRRSRRIGMPRRRARAGDRRRRRRPAPRPSRPTPLHRDRRMGPRLRRARRIGQDQGIVPVARRDPHQPADAGRHRGRLAGPARRTGASHRGPPGPARRSGPRGRAPARTARSRPG